MPLTNEDTENTERLIARGKEALGSGKGDPEGLLKLSKGLKKIQNSISRDACSRSPASCRLIRSGNARLYSILPARKRIRIFRWISATRKR